MAEASPDEVRVYHRALTAAEVQSRYNDGPEGEETLHYYPSAGSGQRLGDKEVALKRGGVVYWLHQDHLGGTAVVSNSFGNQVGSIGYLPYGETRSASGTLGTDRQFTGQRLDGTGLYYYGARYYDPSIGRFISPDTFVQADAQSPTAFLPLAVSYANTKSLEQWNELNRRGAGASALVAGAQDRHETARRVVEGLGVAFQLQDDILGAWGDPVVTGKPADDLKEREWSLPLILQAHLGDHQDAQDVMEQMVRASNREALGHLATVKLSPKSQADFCELMQALASRTT